MPDRRLFIAAYDISDAGRLRKALRVLKGYSTGGQKSVFECFLTPAEHQRLCREVDDVIDPGADSFILVPLEERTAVRTLGIAVPPENPSYFYAG